MLSGCGSKEEVAVADKPGGAPAAEKKAGIDLSSHALAAAKDSLGLVRSSIEAGMPEDMFTIDLADAYRELGLILGEEVEDELIDKIFAEFCMGK